MRLIGVLAVLTVSATAAPSLAQSAHRSVYDGPRDTVARSAPDGARDAVRMPESLTLAHTVESSSKVIANFRVRTNVATVPLGPLGAHDRVHQRLAGSMIDFYPVDGKGFRLSAGSRFYDVRGASRGGAIAGPDASTRALLAVPRTTPGSANRVGQRSSTPALTLGYAGAIGSATDVGLEVGAMKGRAYANTTDLARQSHDSASREVNPVVSLVVGRRF